MPERVDVVELWTGSCSKIWLQLLFMCWWVTVVFCSDRWLTRVQAVASVPTAGWWAWRRRCWGSFGSRRNPVVVSVVTESRPKPCFTITAVTTDLYKVPEAVPPIHAVSSHVATDKDPSKFRSIFSDNLQPIATRRKKARGTLLADNGGCSSKRAPLSVSYYNEISGGHIGSCRCSEEGLCRPSTAPVAVTETKHIASLAPWPKPKPNFGRFSNYIDLYVIISVAPHKEEKKKIAPLTPSPPPKNSMLDPPVQCTKVSIRNAYAHFCIAIKS